MTFMFTPKPEISFTESGEGTPVVLLHGSASNSKQWRSLTEYLNGRFRVICPDLPGYGRSKDVGGNRVKTLEEIVRLLEPVFDHYDEPVHLVGHSFGAAVALKAARMHPGKVRSLTMIEPAVFNLVWAKHGVLSAKTKQFVCAARSSQSALEEGDAWSAMRIFLDFWNGEGSWGRTSLSLCQKLATCAAQIQDDFSALVMDKFTDLDAAGVVCPVLNVTGANSPSEMRMISETLQQSLPFIRHEVVTDAGHMLPMTDPHLTDPMIGEFLEQVDFGWQDAKNEILIAA